MHLKYNLMPFSCKLNKKGTKKICHAWIYFQKLSMRKIWQLDTISSQDLLIGTYIGILIKCWLMIIINMDFEKKLF